MDLFEDKNVPNYTKDLFLTANALKNCYYCLNEDNNPLYPKCTKGENGLAQPCLSVTDQCSTSFLNGTVIHRGCTGDEEAGCFDIGHIKTCNCNRLGHFNDFTRMVIISLFISVPKRQNPFPLLLVKLRNRALKFLVHFSLVCLVAKYPKRHEKWLPMGQGIWGSIFHPSGMLWRPIGSRFLQILQPKGVFRTPERSP